MVDTNISWFDFVRDSLTGLLQDKKKTLKVTLLNLGWFIICAIPIIIASRFINVQNPFDLPLHISLLLNVFIFITFAAFSPFNLISAISLLSFASGNVKDWILFVRNKILKFFLGMLFLWLILVAIMVVVSLGAVSLAFIAGFLPKLLARLIGILLILGILVFLVYLFVRAFSLYTINLAFSDRGIINSLKDSWNMTKSNALQIFLFVSLSFGLGFILMILISVVAAFIAALFGKGIISNIVYLLIGSLPSTIIGLFVSFLVINVLYKFYMVKLGGVDGFFTDESAQSFVEE